MFTFRHIIGVCTAVFLCLNTGCGQMDMYPGWEGGGSSGHSHKVELSPWSSPVDISGGTTTAKVAEIGHHSFLHGRIVSLTLEPARPMMVPFEVKGTWVWVERTPVADENIQYSIKITDPVSKQRIPHPSVRIGVENITKRTSFSVELTPTWGSDGLRYAANKGLLGNGEYAVHVYFDEPIFARSISDQDKWRRSRSTLFYFHINDGQVTAGSISTGTAPGVPGTPVPEHTPASLPSDPRVTRTFMGEATVDNMRIQLFLEPAQSLFMWVEVEGYWPGSFLFTWREVPKAGFRNLVSVVLIDEGSGNRISNCPVEFDAMNLSNSVNTLEDLHTMWGGNGLQYAKILNLYETGEYAATVTIDPPLFARPLSDGDKWMDPIITEFTFTIDTAGMVTATEGHPQP